MSTSFTDQLDRHGAWRVDTAAQLRTLAAWLVAHDLADAPLASRLEQVAEGLLRDRVMVAFVAEFSRGKSELINAIFFAQHGRRIVPASAGRTTMCPTELAFDPGIPPCLQLLPIETRLEARPLGAWRMVHDAWTRLPLDLHDPVQMAKSLETVAQVRRVTPETARSLGFWDDETPEDNPLVGPDGLVEVPMWRHALVNIDHPLLRQGLVVLDTPGLNAIGAEPELTVQLLAEAHATVFLLAADAGVTRSDMGLWREYLAPREGEDPRADSRIVVLNKIDALWDGISSAQDVQAQTERQRAVCAGMLGLVAARVIPLSAQRGLVARINQDAALLQASGLPLLESVLAESIVERRRTILHGTVSSALGRVRHDAARRIAMRRRDIDEQMLELRSLRGKNSGVIAGMRARVEMEQQEFDSSEKRVQALHAVRHRLQRDLRQCLGHDVPLAEFAELQDLLTQPGFKLGARRAYDQAFGRSAERIVRASRALDEIHAMLEACFRQLNTEFGFSLQLPPPPDIAARAEQVAQIARSHAQYVGVGNAIRLSQPAFAGRLARALASRVQAVLADAQQEAESWVRSSVAPVDLQLRERRHAFVRRIDAIDRIRGAASGLGDRMEELEAQITGLDALEVELRERTDTFQDAADIPVVPTSAAPTDAPAVPA